MTLNFLCTPSSLNEHFVEFSSIVVREYEPSSIIAFALDSIHVQREVERMRLQRSGPSLHREKTTTSMRLLDDDDLSTAADGESAGSSVKHLPPILESRLSAMNANISVADGEADEVLLVQKGDGSVDQIEDIVRKGAGVHIKYGRMR